MVIIEISNGGGKMDITLLRTFILLAQNKNFSKTAELMNVVQSTVSTRINELEKILGKRLFVRNNRQVGLSKEGSLYLPYAERIVKLYEESIVKLNTTKFFDDYLVIGSIDSIWRYNLTQLLKKFLIRFPNISVRAIPGHSADITQLILDGVIDIGYVATAPNVNRLEIIDSFEDEVILVVSPSHEISHLSYISIKDLVNMSLLFTDFGSKFKEWASDYLPTRQSFQLQVDPSSLLIPFIKEGLGPGFILRSLVKEELRNGELLKIPIIGDDLPPKWITYTIVDKNKKNDSKIKKWLTIISSVE